MLQQGFASSLQFSSSQVQHICNQQNPVKVVCQVASFKDWYLQAYGVPKRILQPHLHFSGLLRGAAPPQYNLHNWLSANKSHFTQLKRWSQSCCSVVFCRLINMEKKKSCQPLAPVLVLFLMVRFFRSLSSHLDIDFYTLRNIKVLKFVFMCPIGIRHY